ncbi:MAG: class GN sortase [Gammaproteobacteria bacterium]|nr:class GN sortase [Gammaproteobacteria bacterium]MDH3466449.1 class GN sortase [Gammaproteobacteria bacterium]
MRRRAVYILSCALLGGGIWQLSGATYIHAKAGLAQVMLRAAWGQSLADGPPRPPWPGADTWPVARLRIVSAKIDALVLANASGHALAFGPTHVAGSADPGAAGNSIIIAHRDTHFRFLGYLNPGDRITVQTRDGIEHRFAVTAAYVADSRTTLIEDETPRPRLTLVTCYPFDAIQPGGPLRYIVEADLVNGFGNSIGTEMAAVRPDIL